jgi:uncharacterized membrane protein HdeD (DUF308 family)
MVILVFGDWRKVALRGVAAVLFGAATLIWPRLTLTALVLLFGAYVLVDGVFTLAAILTDGPETRAERGWLALEGIVSVLIGMITLIWPDITALALLYLIAFWAAATGVLEIATAVRLRRQIRNEWLLSALGLLSIVFAAVLLISPASGALAITWLIGWYALFSGALVLGLAYELRKIQSASGRAGRARSVREASA